MDEQLIKVTNNENPTINLEIGVNTNAIDIEFSQSMTTAIAGHNEDIEAHSKTITTIKNNLTQIDTSLRGINNSLSEMYTKVETNAELAKKISVSDESITKQGNTFNGSNQLVKINSNGQLPSIDGSLLAGIVSEPPTLDTSNMPILANNATNPNTQIDFGAGFCYDNTLKKKITSTSKTKKLDAAFAEGHVQGGLDTGTKAASTWYHCFAIAKTDGTSDFLFSTNAVAPTMPSGYTYKRRIGSIKTDNSGNVIKFYQNGDRFTWDVQVMDVSIATGSLPTAAALKTISTPIGLETTAILFAYIVYQGATTIGLITSPNIADTAPVGIYNIATTSPGGYFNDGYTNLSIETNTSSQIRIRFSTVNGTLSVFTLGYIDKRGKK